MKAIGEVVKLLESALQLCAAVFVAVIETKHAYKDLLEHRRFAVGRHDVLAEVPRFDVKTRKLVAIADNLEIASIDQLAILRALDDAHKIVLREGAHKGDANAQQVRNIFKGMKLLLGFLGLRFHGNIGQKADFVGKGVQIVGAFEPLLDDVQRHIARLLKMQDDLKPLDIVHGVLAIPLGRAVRSDEPFVFKESNLRVGEVGIRAA